MLVLTRRAGEKIMIGDAIEVIVLAARGLHVRLGIKAPRGVDIHREEIYKKKQKEKEVVEKRGNQEL